MAILEEYTNTVLTPNNVVHFEAKGYPIPREMGKWGKITVQRGTTMRVKVADLPPCSCITLTKVCDICHKQVPEQTHSNILRNRRSGLDLCKSCAKQRSNRTKAEQGHNLSNLNPEVSKLWHPTLNGENTPKNTMPSSGNQVWWMCDEEECKHSWSATVYRVASGTRCPYCSMSKGERRIRSYLTFLGYMFSHEEKIEELVGISGGLLSYDFAVTYPDGSHALFIEFDGVHHSKPVDFTGKGKAHAIRALKRQQIHDMRKDEYSSISNIPLLRIRYDDYHNIERKINEALAEIIREK